MKTKSERRILSDMNKANSRLTFWKERVKLLILEHRGFKKEFLRSELVKAINIIESIKNKYQLKDNFHRSKSRKRTNTDIIYKTIKLVSSNTKVEMTVLGKLFNRNRTSINHSLKTVDNLMDTDRQYRAEFESMCSDLKLKYKRFKPRVYKRKSK